MINILMFMRKLINRISNNFENKRHKMAENSIINIP